MKIKNRGPSAPSTYEGAGVYLWHINVIKPMRLQLHLSPSTQPVPFDHLHQLTGAIHKWLGPNNLHDGLSLYSFGWLRGGKPIGRNLFFLEKATWTVGFHDEGRAWQLARGILKDPVVAFGMKVEKAIETPLLTEPTQIRFKVDGMVVARRKRPDGSREYLLWDNPDADKMLTGIFQQKLSAAGFGTEHLSATVQFDRSFARARTKFATIKSTKHKGSECPVIIRGTPDAIRFAQLVGVGDLTGSGFGALL